MSLKVNNSNTLPLVSIVTPVYNSAKYIEETIGSVLSQTHSNWEWIMVNDCSSDHSRQIIEKYIKQDHRISLINLENNSGPAISRNEGIRKANGKYLSFIDSDDLWHDRFLEEMIAFMASHDIMFAFASYDRLDENLNPYLDPFIVPDKVSYFSLLKTCPISCLTAVIDLEVLGKKYMRDIAKRQDYTLWLQYLKLIPYAYGNEDILATYRMRRNSVSRNKWKAGMYQWHVYYHIEKLGIIRSIYYLFFWFISGLRKYYTKSTN